MRYLAFAAMLLALPAAAEAHSSCRVIHLTANHPVAAVGMHRFNIVNAGPGTVSIRPSEIHVLPTDQAFGPGKGPLFVGTKGYRYRLMLAEGSPPAQVSVCRY